MLETYEERPIGAQLGADGKPLNPDDPADAEIIRWQTTSPYYVPPHNERHKHIVDVLIRERAKRLSSSRFWRFYRVGLNRLLGYQGAKRMVDTAGRWNATDAFAHASSLLDMKLDVTGMEHIPREGAFIIALNHPTGIADGLAVHDALAPVRPDVIVFVNADAIRLNPRLTDKLIPVEWRADKKSRAKSRETLKATNAAFAAARAVVLFPSGRLAYMNEDKHLVERPWQPTIAALAKKYDCPIVPANLVSRNSWLYYWFNNVDTELRDMTLFHELLNKKGKTSRITIERPIDPDVLLEDNEAAAAELRAYVCEGVPKGLTFGDWRAAEAASA
ncbi:1-acyl-sn-glycerol-3-phosphate acyltransferase [Parvularcula dongshanensis]|uniref:Putative hemolysin n=1 Tax=Parvularcula dongshanensis TaxID=1173995 RepID=A0A840I112_9PROT|nr:1-acyl-sn-glycerol-3-phosphate acyltransferase [Parvularcula dongshanensis]MBB4657971.1 putative hemolysin [Parvularcula dongshanensis]